VEQGGDELDLLLHALGEVFGSLGKGFGDMQLFAPVAGSFLGDGPAEIVEPGEEDELVQHVHLLVEAAFLGQIADPR